MREFSLATLIIFVRRSAFWRNSLLCEREHWQSVA